MEFFVLAPALNCLSGGIFSSAVPIWVTGVQLLSLKILTELRDFKWARSFLLNCHVSQYLRLALRRNVEIRSATDYCRDLYLSVVLFVWNSYLPGDIRDCLESCIEHE